MVGSRIRMRLISPTRNSHAAFNCRFKLSGLIAAGGDWLRLPSIRHADSRWALLLTCCSGNKIRPFQEDILWNLGHCYVALSASEAWWAKTCDQIITEDESRINYQVIGLEKLLPSRASGNIGQPQVNNWPHQYPSLRTRVNSTAASSNSRPRFVRRNQVAV